MNEKNNWTMRKKIHYHVTLAHPTAHPIMKRQIKKGKRKYHQLRAPAVSLTVLGHSNDFTFAKS
jgi:hypothetical protein